MNKILCIVVLAALVGAAATAQESRPTARASIAALAWLAGEWRGDAGASSIEEHWTAPAAGAMFAVARTIKGDRTVAFEFLRIIERDGRLVYIAQPNGRPPTEFVLTAIGERGATFENAAHDFPKVIRYAVQADGTLEARVSDGGERSETFRFARHR
jgi:hypothetical protein